MARTRKTSKEALEEKIEKAEADVIAAKKNWKFTILEGTLGSVPTVTSARLVFRGRSKAKEKAASEGGKKSLVELFDEIV